MNPARTAVLDTIYLLFVEFSHNCRTQLLEAFTPLFRQLFLRLNINESSVANNVDSDGDAPCFNVSLTIRCIVL